MGAGEGGFGVTMLAIVKVSVPITRMSPAERPVVLESRIAVAPAAAAWFRVVFVVAPRERFPDVSTAR